MHIPLGVGDRKEGKGVPEIYFQYPGLILIYITLVQTILYKKGRIKIERERIKDRKE